jgi:hypothetical protein
MSEVVNTIISFDIGIKNMAICIMRGDNIVKWGLIDIGKCAKMSEVGKITDNLIIEMDKIVMDYMEGHDDKYIILVENQPVMKAPTMKSIQMILYSYFKILNVHEVYNIDVQLVSAMKKNSFLKCKGKDVKNKVYKSYKNNSIEYIESYLTENGLKSELDILESYKKKDDICDALLQILCFKENK